MFNLFKRKKAVTFMIDENVKMSRADIALFKDCEIVNSTDYASKGTIDIKLINIAKKKGWVVVTKDIKMATRSLLSNVPTIYVSDEFKSVSFLCIDIYGKDYYPEMFDYLKERFNYK